MDDHQFSEGGTGAIFFVLDPARYRALPPQERYRFIIDTVVPWYLGFYLRWRRLDMVLHSYEQMVIDPHSYFVEILTGIRQGAPLDEGHLDAALSIDPSLVGRFNVGKVGRSAEKFDDATKRRLEKKILSHPDREQLEILLWELPWEATLLKRRSPLDGSVVRAEGSERAHFITSGRAHPIDRPAWLLSRAGGRRLPRTIAEAELRAFPIGDPMI